MQKTQIRMYTRKNTGIVFEFRHDIKWFNCEKFQ